MTQYGNWIPKWLLNTILLGLILLFGLSILFLEVINTVIGIILSLITIIYAIFTIKTYYMSKEFDYNNKNSTSWKIIKFVASYVKLGENYKLLDIGCGSGALSIECAKNNRDAIVIGMDRWGTEYKAFSKQICDFNAKEEKVNNTTFIQGDITKLDLKKESFDFITSNYVIHNVPGDKTEMLVNILDLLKKGGSFAIHDLFSKRYYGDSDILLALLKEKGFEKVELISTTEGSPMTNKEAKRLMLGSSKLLIGTK
ncbi:MAG: class I SAM-dependent methyltransferase [Pleomorphochaeta sp.]